MDNIILTSTTISSFSKEFINLNQNNANYGTTRYGFMPFIEFGKTNFYSENVDFKKYL